MHSDKVANVKEKEEKTKLQSCLDSQPLKKLYKLLTNSAHSYVSGLYIHRDVTQISC